MAKECVFIKKYDLSGSIQINNVSKMFNLLYFCKSLRSVNFKNKIG